MRHCCQFSLTNLHLLICGDLQIEHQAFQASKDGTEGPSKVSDSSNSRDSLMEH